MVHNPHLKTRKLPCLKALDVAVTRICSSGHAIVSVPLLAEHRPEHEQAVLLAVRGVNFAALFNMFPNFF
jgi:hypothetical protein